MTCQPAPKPKPKSKPAAEQFPFPGEPAGRASSNDAGDLPSSPRVQPGAAQPNTAEQPNHQTVAPAPSAASPGKSAAQQFPFPGEPHNPPASQTTDASQAPNASQAPSTPGADGQKPKPAAQQFPFPGEPPETPPAPSAPSPANPAGKSAADKFPFPGETSIPTDPATSDIPQPGSSSSSSSSDSGGDPAAPANGAPGLKDEGSEGEVAGHHANHNIHIQTPAEREDEDLRVAKFYLSSGDLPGAYLRGKDAVATQPDDPDAYFALAEGANGTKRRDEAIAAYRKVLELDPGGNHDKAVRKALHALGVNP
jgi:hypothetical protein